MKIDRAALERWKKNSLLTAMTLDYDKIFLEKMLKENDRHMQVFLEINDKLERKTGFWFGLCSYGVTGIIIKVSPNNLSTLSGEKIEEALQQIKLPEKEIEKIMSILKNIPEKKFFEIFNQSGMDHELIGHGYHYFKDEDHGEEVAVKVQIRMAEVRAKQDKDWKVIHTIMPLVLGYLKGITL